MSFLRPPPKGTHLKPWVPDAIFVPLGRGFERVFTYLYNRVLARSEIGLYKKGYDPKVHGPYCHWRYYGKQDTKLFDVKLGELSSWVGRRDKSVTAIYNEFVRNIYRVHHHYYSGPVAAPVLKTLFRYALAFAFINWLWKASRFADYQKTRYHW